MNINRSGRMHIGVENLLRKVASDNDIALMRMAGKNARLSRTIGTLKERERSLRMELAEKSIEVDQLHEQLEAERNVSTLLMTGTDGETH